MRQTVYKCDECKKEIGEKKHLSMHFGEYSGVAVPVKPLPYTASDRTRWVVASSLNEQFMHFCNAQCLQRFFSALLKRTVVKDESPF